MDFWDIPASAKWSELDENRHKRLLKEALNDKMTGITTYERDQYILYDKQGIEALVYRPKTVLTKISMRLYHAVLLLFPKGDEL